MQINIKNLVDDEQCYETVRKLHWPEGQQCPFCDSKHVIKRGFDEKETDRQSAMSVKDAVSVSMI